MDQRQLIIEFDQDTTAPTITTVSDLTAALALQPSPRLVRTVRESQSDGQRTSNLLHLTL